MKKLTGLLLLTLLSGAPATAQDWAKTRLNHSPRHLEFVKVAHGGRTVNCFVAYPEVKGKATTILLIHEIFGLSDWVRSLADELAEAGYVVVVPDLLSGMGPNGGGTTEFGSEDNVRKAVSNLPQDQVRADLQAVQDYGVKLPASNGKIAVAGFCWGGTQAFRFATDDSRARSVEVFYGTAPEDQADLSRIHAPVYGFYAGNDARVSSTVPATEASMKRAGKIYEPVVYAGAGHGFMRAGEAPDAKSADKKARNQAWKRWMSLLKKV